MQIEIRHPIGSKVAVVTRYGELTIAEVVSVTVNEYSISYRLKGYDEDGDAYMFNLEENDVHATREDAAIAWARKYGVELAPANMQVRFVPSPRKGRQ